MATDAGASAMFSVPADGNEDSCGACRGIGVLICCENCPAAYHATCAGYKDEDDIPGGEDDPWLCWSCSRDTKTPFAQTESPTDAKVGDWVMLGVREGAITYHKAKATAIAGGKLTVRHNDLNGTLEEVPITSPRLWHGTLDDNAWEKRHNSYMPLSRAYGIDTALIKGMNGSSSARTVQPAARGPGLVPSPDLKRRAPAEAEQPNKAPKLTANLHAPPVPAPRSTPPAKGLGAGLPLHRGPSLPARPVNGTASPPAAGRASNAAAQPQQNGSASKQQSTKKQNLELPDKGCGGLVIKLNGRLVLNPDYQPGSKGSNTGGTGSNTGGVGNSAADAKPIEYPSRERFTRLYTSWLRQQGDTAERTRQYYEDIELDMFLLWTRILQYGSLEAVNAVGAWPEVAEQIGLPDSVLDKGSICRRRFKAARLDEFTEDCKTGHIGIRLPPTSPPVRAAAPSSAAAPTPSEKATRRKLEQQAEAIARPKSFRQQIRERRRPVSVIPAATPTDAQAGASAEPEQHAQSLAAVAEAIMNAPSEDPMEVPIEPERAHSLPATRPFAPAADGRIVGWTEAMKDHPLKPGSEVEARSVNGPYLGGWQTARVLEVAPGSMWEGGLRVHVELQPVGSSSQSEQKGIMCCWLPLVHAPANGAAPAVVVRLPSKPALLPKKWAVGDRVEGSWAEGESWWPASVYAVLPKGYLELRLEPTAMHPEGEMWEIHSSLVRKVPNPDQGKQVLLHTVQDSARVTPENLRHRLAWQQYFVDDDWVLESYSTENSIFKTPEQLLQRSVQLSNSDRQPIASSLDECLQVMAKRPLPKSTSSGGPSQSHTAPATAQPAGCQRPSPAAVNTQRMQTTTAAAKGKGKATAAAGSPAPDTAKPQNRSSPHQSVARAGAAAVMDLTTDIASPDQPIRRSHSAALRASQSAPGPRPGHITLAPRSAQHTQQPAQPFRPNQPNGAAGPRMQSSSGRLPEERTRRPLATLIPMAGRTGKLSPVQSPSCRHSSHIASLPGYLAKQQTSGAPSRSRTHVWPSKCAANGSARPDMASGSSSSGVRSQAEGSSRDLTHVVKVRKALLPHNRSELRKPYSRTANVIVQLPPLGPRFGIGRVEHSQNGTPQQTLPPTYPRINFSIGLAPLPMQRPQPEVPQPVSTAGPIPAAPAPPAPSQAQRPVSMSKLVAALQFSPHFQGPHK